MLRNQRCSTDNLGTAVINGSTLVMQGLRESASAALLHGSEITDDNLIETWALAEQHQIEEHVERCIEKFTADVDRIVRCDVPVQSNTPEKQGSVQIIECIS